jgi:hypothetical protein
MEFDYYTLYKNWSTLDLVRVARTPNDYAPEAVVVAKNILKERRVSLEEMDAAEWELAQAEMAAAIGKPRISDYIERFTEVFRPERGQASETGPGWYTALLVLYGVYYIFNIYSVTKYLVYLHRCVACKPDMAGVWWNLGLAIFITVCFYFVLKQRSLGWAMLLIQTIVLGCMKVSLLFSFYEHHVFFSSLLPFYVLPVLLYAAVGFFLRRPAVIAFFGINGLIKDRALLIGVAVGILAMALTASS